MKLSLGIGPRDTLRNCDAHRRARALAFLPPQAELYRPEGTAGQPRRFLRNSAVICPDVRSIEY